MKNFKTLLVLCFFGSFINCEKPKDIADYIVISGTIENSAEKEIVLQSTGLFYPTTDRKITIPLNSNGSFRDTLRVSNGQYILAEGNNYMPLYLYDGVNLDINYNSKDQKNTVNLLGEGSGVTRYLISSGELMDQFYDREHVENNAFNLNEKDFTTKVEKLISKLENLLKSSDSIPDHIYKTIEKDIRYNKIDLANRYVEVRPFISGDSTYKPSKEFTKELDSLKFDNYSDFKTSRIYQYLVFGHFRKMAQQDTVNFKKSPEFESLKVYSKIPNDSIKDLILEHQGMYILPRSNDRKKVYDFLMEHLTNVTSKTRFTDLYEKLSVLDTGMPSPTFTNYVNHKGGANSLSDFKGKYVFIDIWATWCGPCLHQVPFLEKIEDMYRDKNIEFVSISIDSQKDYDKWKNMVSDKGMKGIQLYADNAFESEFIKLYQINAIPRFILIDPKGNIVAANAPKPSDQELKDMLDKLL